jgi:predicted permease
VALWLAGVAAIVLAIACANVANLLLMRGFRRRREIAVRRALGMGQRRLVAQLATESLVLAVLGGVAALAATEWVGRPLRALLLPEVAWDRGPVDTRVFGLTVLAIFLAAFVTGVIPSFALGRANLSAELKSGGRGLATRRSRLQAALLVTQTTLSALLLVGAGWFLESVAKVRALHLGLDADRVLVTTIDFPTAYKPAEIATFYERALDRVRSVPGVAHASLGQADPFGWSFGAGVRVPGHDSLPSPETGGPYYNGVTEDFFATLGTRLLRGRLFSQADRAGTAPVAVINATMARLYWPNEESVGRCFYIGDGSGACTEVIGVVEDARRGGLTEGPTLQFYLPLGQVRFENARRVLFIRAAGEPAALIPSVRRALLDLSPTLPYARIESLQSRVDPQTRSWRLGATMLTAFGILALLVSAVGLYSTIAYSLTQRTLEIGVRMALGARSREVVRLVIGEGMRLALLGLGVGIGLAVVLGRQMRGLLFQTSPGDLRVLAIAAAVLAVAAVAASFFPASRAARLDPATTLRVE